jgi:hypothetical protein
MILVILVAHDGKLLNNFRNLGRGRQSPWDPFPVKVCRLNVVDDQPPQIVSCSDAIGAIKE